MQRDALKHLGDWQKTARHKPLLFRGARQVGKTHLIQTFGKQHFKNVVTVNFEKQPAACALFEADLDPRRIINEISLLGKNPPITAENTLLFFDEIQACPKAITALRYFYEDLPDLHVIAAGSLLEIGLTQAAIAFPVGRIASVYLYPLSFCEFLSAVGQAALRTHLEHVSLANPLSETIHEHAMALVKQYCLVGGMPEVVATFAEHGQLNACEQYQNTLIDTFRSDFAKYARQMHWTRMHKVFDYCARSIGQKITYSKIDPNEKSRDLSKALQLLAMAQVVQLVQASSGTGLPLSALASAKHAKALFLDIGLAQCIGQLQAELVFTKQLSQVNQGALAEQFVGQELLANAPAHQASHLYYWTTEAKSNQAEVDFLVQVKNQIVPLEVKSGPKGSLKSLHQFLKTYRLDHAIKVSAQPLSVEDHEVRVLPERNKIKYKLLNLPFYLLHHRKLIEEFIGTR